MPILILAGMPGDNEDAEVANVTNNVGVEGVEADAGAEEAANLTNVGAEHMEANAQPQNALDVLSNPDVLSNSMLRRENILKAG